jgi:hypothetical protein
MRAVIQRKNPNLLYPYPKREYARQHKQATTKEDTMYLKSQESQGQERTIQGAYGQGYASASSDAKPHDAFFCAPARHQSPQAEKGDQPKGGNGFVNTLSLPGRTQAFPGAHRCRDKPGSDV